MRDAALPNLHGGEDHIDGCLCDVELDEGELLADADLPPAAGGVQADVERLDNDDAIDGCDVNFDPTRLTTDRELPIAAGGIVKG